MAKVCVLKRMSPELRTPEQIARFGREATMALRLSHGAIAQTFSVDEIEGELCIVQEFIQGVSLSHLLRTCRQVAEPLPVEIAVYVARELARALAYAHGSDGGGVVHRDVTPDNVMLSYGGEVKLIDFGIAKAAGDTPSTGHGKIVGRRSHTAPEVLAGRVADGRADLFSLGVLLWQALTGQAPIEVEDRGPDSFAAPSATNRDVRAELDDIVGELLAETPDDRQQGAAEVVEELGTQLPRGFVGERALARLLARYYDVNRERSLLSAEIGRAGKGLAPAEKGPAPTEKGYARIASAPGVTTGALEPLGAVSFPQRPRGAHRAKPVPTEAGKRGGRKTVAVVASAVAIVAAAGMLRFGSANERRGARGSAVGAAGAPAAVVGGAAPSVVGGVATAIVPAPAVMGSPPGASVGAAPLSAGGAPAGRSLEGSLPAPGWPAARARSKPPSNSGTPRPLAPATKDPSASTAADLIQRAERSFDRGDVVQALALARAAVEAGGGERAHIIAGKVLLADGRLGEAEVELAAATQLAPGDRDAATLLERLRARRARHGE
jgi:hypothetical protein